MIWQMYCELAGIPLHKPKPAHKCAFTADVPRHTDEAVVRVRLPEGCICYPDASEQWLCWQHYDKMAQNGVEHEILEDLRR